MALMEVLIGASILAAAMLAFLAILREARSDLAAARNTGEATAVAMSALSDARSSWASGPYSGTRAGFAWRRACAVSREASSPRLVLVGCTVSVARAGARPLTLNATWAAPRQGALRRP